MKFSMACVLVSMGMFACTTSVPQEHIETYVQETNGLKKLEELAIEKEQKIVSEQREKGSALVEVWEKDQKVLFETDEQLQEKIKDKKQVFDALRLKYLDLKDSINLQVAMNEKFIAHLQTNKMRVEAVEKQWKNYEHKIRDYEVSVKKMAWQLEDASKDVYMLYQVAQAKYGRAKVNNQK